MFCPKCGSKQEERRFCTVCGTNLAAVSQALHLPATAQFPSPVSQQHLAQPALRHLMPYEMERQREYVKGMKMLVIGGAFLGYNILKVLLSFGHTSFGFWGFLSLIVFAIGLSKVLSWKQVASGASDGGWQTAPAFVTPPTPAATPSTAQLRHFVPAATPLPQPVFSALQPATRTGAIEPARLTSNATANLSAYASVVPSVVEDETRRLPEQQSPAQTNPAGSQANWKTE
jgi:hypothetical protein